jgi:hypothetical protein
MPLQLMHMLELFDVKQVVWKEQIDISYNKIWTFNINFFKSWYILTEKFRWKPLHKWTEFIFIWHTYILKTKLLKFPNISVLSFNLMLGYRNLQTRRENQTPPSSCHPLPFYTFLIKYEIHYSININYFDAVHVWAKNNMICKRLSFYLTTVAGHNSLLLHHTCRHSAEWAAVI